MRVEMLVTETPGRLAAKALVIAAGVAAGFVNYGSLLAGMTIRLKKREEQRKKTAEEFSQMAKDIDEAIKKMKEGK